MASGQSRSSFHKLIDFRRPTTYEFLSLCVSVIGLISLLFLIQQTQAMATQTKQLSDSLESTAYQTITNQLLDLNKIFIDYPELWPYFYLGKDITEQDPDYYRVLAIANFHIDFFDSFWAQSDHLPALQHDGPEWEAWSAYIRDSFSKSPIMCKRLAQVEKWYTSDFIAFVGDACP